MELKTYQAEALKTALPSALSLNYLVPGLIAEIGECYGKIAKAERDGWDANRADDELASEWADCAWFAAVLSHVLDAPEDAETYTIEPRSAMDSLSVLTETALWIDRWLDRRDVSTGAQEVWQLLRDHCATVTGKPFDVVLEANLAKLADRQQRGTISGQGDSR